MADIHVRVRHLVVPASVAGNRQALTRDVIEAIEQHVQSGSKTTRIGGAGAKSTASRIGEAVRDALRETQTLSRSVR